MADTADGTPSDDQPFLDTLEGEISFFRSLMRARPVGLHRHFHVLSIREWIRRDTKAEVSPEDIWSKLRSCYELDILEANVRGMSYIMYQVHTYAL
jgi:MRG-binding protein